LIGRFVSSLPFLLGFVIVIGVVELVNGSMDHQLNAWGILPRTVHGLAGIPLSPFLHGSFSHVISNAVTFLGLGGLVGLRGRQVLFRVSLIVILIGGAGVWAFGRSATHIGASGLVFGYFGYLVARGWYERRFGPILVAIGVIILYGGLIVGVFPTQGLVSWEAHLFGLNSRCSGRKNSTEVRFNPLATLQNQVLFETPDPRLFQIQRLGLPFWSATGSLLYRGAKKNGVAATSATPSLSLPLTLAPTAPGTSP